MGENNSKVINKRINVLKGYLSFGSMFFLLLVSSYFVLTKAHSAEKNTDTHLVKHDLNKTLSYAIELLEKNKIDIFFRELIYPSEFKIILKKHAFKKNFLKKKNNQLSKSEKLLLELKYIRMRHPMIDDKNLSETARFAYDQPSGRVKIITFFKADNEWWLAN